MIEVLNTCSCAFIVKAGHVIQLLFLIFRRTDTQDVRNSGIRHLQPQIQPLGSAITFKLIAPQISKKNKTNTDTEKQACQKCFSSNTKLQNS